MSARTIVITGASRGLGRVLAERIAGRGHRLAACGRNAEHIAALEHALPRAEGAPEHVLRPVDVTDPGAVAAWAEEVVARLGAPDLVLNNAGVINRRAPLWQLEPKDVAKVLEVNVMGIVHVVRAFVPAMIERGAGLIVNFSSGWGHSTAPDVAPYCASKYAVEGLTGALAQELPAGVGAVAWSPGIIHTEMLDTAMGDAAASFPDPETWADDAVPYLLALDPVRDNGKSLRLPGH